MGRLYYGCKIQLSRTGLNSGPAFEMTAKIRLQHASLITYLAQFATLYIFNINSRKLRNVFAIFPTTAYDFLLNATPSIRRLLASHLRRSSRRADLLSRRPTLYTVQYYVRAVTLVASNGSCLYAVSDFNASTYHCDLTRLHGFKGS